MSLLCFWQVLIQSAFWLRWMFNSSGAEPFSLSVSMGYAEFRPEDDTETFLRNMDEKMYEKKRKYHSLNQAERLKKDQQKI